MTLKKFFLRTLLVLGILIAGFIAYLFYYFNFVVTSARSGTPFKVAHERAVKSFVEGEYLGIMRFQKAEYFHERSVMLDDVKWRIEDLSLIGASPEFGERYFKGGRLNLRKRELGEAEHRPLNRPEEEAITRLRERKDDSVILEEKSGAAMIRVVAPIFAEVSCLECHEVPEGDLLGAFEYLLVREQ